MNPELFRQNVVELCERLEARAVEHEQKVIFWSRNDPPVMDEDETLREFRVRQEEFAEALVRHRAHAETHQRAANDLRQAVHVMRMQNSLYVFPEKDIMAALAQYRYTQNTEANDDEQLWRDNDEARQHFDALIDDFIAGGKIK